MSLSPDGETVVTAADKAVHIVDIAAGSVRKSIGVDGEVRDARLLRNGLVLIALLSNSGRSEDTRVMLAETDFEAPARTLHEGWPLTEDWWKRSAALAVTPTGYGVFGGADGCIYAIASDYHATPALIGKHDAAVTSLATHNQGNTVVSTHQDGTIIVWDATTGSRQRVLSNPGEAVRSCAVTDDGSIFAACDEHWAIWRSAVGTVS